MWARVLRGTRKSKGARSARLSCLRKDAELYEELAALKGQTAEAEKELGKAVELPANVPMTGASGRARTRRMPTGRATRSSASEADDKLVGPYVELGQLAAQGQKWDDTAKYLDRALALDPIDYPQLWFVAAVADYNTRHFDAAEHSVREAIKTDPEGKNPRSSQLLGLILDQKNDTAGALAAFREFLRLVPTGSDAEKTTVEELEAISKTN